MATQNWKIDTSHSTLGFVVRHMVFAKVRGQFTKWEGSFATEDGVPVGPSIKASAETASVDTHEPKRDDHLRSDDFFGAEKFPTLSFAGGTVEKHGDKLRITGNLTIRDATKPVTLEAEMLGGGKDPWGNQRAIFSAKASIDRREFGLKWNAALEAGGVLVSEKVDIEIEIQAVAG